MTATTTTATTDPATTATGSAPGSTYVPAPALANPYPPRPSIPAPARTTRHASARKLAAKLAVVAIMCLGYAGFSTLSAHDAPRCGGKVMTPGDLCVGTRSGTQSYAERKADQEDAPKIWFGLAAVTGAAAAIAGAASIERRPASARAPKTPKAPKVTTF